MFTQQPNSGNSNLRIYKSHHYERRQLRRSTNCNHLWTISKLRFPLRSPTHMFCRKSEEEECVFVYIALHIKCQFNKNLLLQCYFLAFVQAGNLEELFFVFHCCVDKFVTFFCCPFLVSHKCL